MVSFIIPTYNAARYLPTCIASIQAQTVKDWEAIVMDDGSTDDSLAIAKSFATQDARIKVYAQTHAGQSAARNYGMKQSQGTFIAFVDADDWIESDWLAIHLAAIEGVDYVQSGQASNRFQPTVVWQRLYRREAIAELLFEEGMIYEDVLWSVDLWVSGASCRVIDYNGYHYTANPHSTTSHPHPEAQKKVIHALRKRFCTTPLSKKWIIAYTILRIKIHFLKQ